MSKQNTERFNVIRVPYWATNNLGTLAGEALRPPPQNEPVDPLFKSAMQMTQESLERAIAEHGSDDLSVKMLRRQLERGANPESFESRFRSAPIENRRDS